MRLSWLVAGFREVERSLRARQWAIAWALAAIVAREGGLRTTEVAGRAWCRVLGVRYVRTCSRERCLAPAVRGGACCPAHLAELERAAPASARIRARSQPAAAYTRRIVAGRSAPHQPEVPRLMTAAPLPVLEVTRRQDCPMYVECLAFAARRGWRHLHCGRCEAPLGGLPLPAGATPSQLRRERQRARRAEVAA